MQIDYSYREEPSHLPYYKDQGGMPAPVVLYLDRETGDVGLRVALHQWSQQPLELIEIPFSAYASKCQLDDFFREHHQLLQRAVEGDYQAVEELETLGSSGKWMDGWEYTQEVDRYLDGMSLQGLCWDNLDSEAERIQQLFFKTKVVLDPTSLSYYLQDLLEELENVEQP